MSRPTCAYAACDAQPPAIDPKTGKPIGREGARGCTTECQRMTNYNGQEA